MILSTLFKSFGLVLSFASFQRVHCQDSIPSNLPTPVLIGRAQDPCVIPEVDYSGNNETATLSWLSNDRGVPYYLNTILEKVIKPKYGNLDHWYKRFMDQYKDEPLYSNMTNWELADCYNMDTENCENPPEDSSCHAQPEIWYTLRTFYNFHDFMRQYHSIFAETVGSPVYVPLIRDLAADFPMKVTTGFSPSALLNILGTILSIASAGASLIPGGEGVGGTAGFIGAIISAAGSATENSDSGSDTVHNALEDRVATIWNSTVSGSRHFLNEFFEAPDLKEFPGWKAPAACPETWCHAGYDMDQMKFLDNGAFFDHVQINEDDWRTSIEKGLKASLTAVALTEANWYILKDGYSPDECPSGDGKSGMVINNSCYTLESVGPDDGFYSMPIDSDTLKKVTDRGVDLQKLYQDSDSFQTANNGYYSSAMGQPMPYNTDADKVGSFFYTMPVLIADYQGKNKQDHTPCKIRALNKTEHDTVVGRTYLPPNLDGVFTTDWCGRTRNGLTPACRGSKGRRCIA